MSSIEIPTQVITVADLKIGDMIKWGAKFVEVTQINNGGNESLLSLRGIDQARMVPNTKRVRIAER